MSIRILCGSFSIIFKLFGMANLKQIKTKIKSVSNLKKITRALEIVSTVKLQKVKEKAEWLKQYLLDLMAVLSHIENSADLFEIVERSQSTRTLVVVITSERWLCWWLNVKLLKKVMEEHPVSDQVDYFVLGKKWSEYIARVWWNVLWTLHIWDSFDEEELTALYVTLDNAIDTKSYGNIMLYFNYFKNSMAQLPASVPLLQFTKKTFDAFLYDIWVSYDFAYDIGQKDILVEPNAYEFLMEARRQIRHYMIASALLQNKAWEHAARMIAMKNATDNARDFVDTLTLSFNKARQWAITQEISEIVSAKIAIEW